MIRRKKHFRKMVIDLTGPQGNAFYLLGIAQGIMQKLGQDPEPLLERMTSGDYENLILEMDRELGNFIILER